MDRKLLGMRGSDSGISNENVRNNLFDLGVHMIRTLTIAAAICLAVPAIAAEEVRSPIQTPALFSETYIPAGFDDNDNVQIVGEGMFKNTCYRPAPTGVQVDQKNKVIRLAPAAYEYQGLCLQMILPFERTIDVGILKAGNYKVMQDGQEVDTLKVGVARSLAPDDYLYAPISQAYIHQEAGLKTLLVSGEFPTDCMKLDYVSTDVQKKVIVVQPIAKIEERNNCLRGKFPFSTSVELKNIPEGRYLIHVRSMNSKAVNTLVDIVQ